MIVCWLEAMADFLANPEHCPFKDTFISAGDFWHLTHKLCLSCPSIHLKVLIDIIEASMSVISSDSLSSLMKSDMVAQLLEVTKFSHEMCYTAILHLFDWWTHKKRVLLVPQRELVFKVVKVGSVVIDPTVSIKWCDPSLVDLVLFNLELSLEHLGHVLMHPLFVTRKQFVIVCVSLSS
jgi:hypothetical protein